MKGTEENLIDDFVADNLVIEPEFALGHAAQVRLHGDAARHVTREHLPWGDINRLTFSSTSRNISFRRYCRARVNNNE